MEIGLLPWVVCASGIVFESWVIFNNEWRWRIINVSTWWNWWNLWMRRSTVDGWTTGTSFQCDIKLIHSVHQWIFRCRRNIASKIIAVFRYEEHVGGSQVLGSSKVISGAMPNWWTVHIEVFCYQRNIFIRSNSWCDVREMCGVRRKVFCSRWNIFIKTVCLLTKQDVIVSTITTATFSASVYFDDLLHFLQLQPDQRTFVIFPFILPEVVYICTSASTMCFVSW